jgi:hypothetical protein
MASPLFAGDIPGKFSEYFPPFHFMMHEGFHRFTLHHALHYSSENALCTPTSRCRRGNGKDSVLHSGNKAENGGKHYIHLEKWPKHKLTEVRLLKMVSEAPKTIANFARNRLRALRARAKMSVELGERGKRNICYSELQLKLVTANIVV